jgi:hypothetical protein
VRRILVLHRHALYALVCGGVATVLVLLALDARSWQTTVARDDLRFRALPAHTHLWQPQTILPGDPASLLIGTTSTVRYRHALQYFWFSRIGSNPELRQDLPTLRAAAQSKLQQLVAGGATNAQRSAAANLLGILVVTAPPVVGSPGGVTQTLTRSAEYFQQAITLDPTNRDAKENLEIVLRLSTPGKSKLGYDARAGYGMGKGQGAGKLGGGY